MRITLVSSVFPHPERGRQIGIERHVSEFARALHEAGHSIQVITTFWNGGSAREVFNGLEIVRLEDSAHRWGVFGRQFDLPYISFTRGLLRNRSLIEHADVVHAISPVYIAQLLEGLAIPFITHFHHRDQVRRAVELLKYPFTIPHQKEMFSTSDAVVTMTAQGRNELMKHYGVNDNLIHVIPHGVDLYRFHPNNERVTLKTLRRLLFVGTLTGRKGVTFLIDAFAIVRQAFPSVQLILVGDGEDMAMLRNQAIRLELQDSVDFLGRVDDDELIRQYQAADVFVFPSLQEGFGIPLIEAMACGVPIVSTTATSIPDVVGDVGVLVEPARAEPLAKAILRILEGTALGQQLVRAGLTRSREHFDWNNVARRFVDLYRSLQMRKSMRRRADKEPS